MPAKLNLEGKRFGKLVAVSSESKRTSTGSRKYWFCKCDCGGSAVVPVGNLVSGNTISCGCAKIDACLRRVTHKKSGTFEHRVWKGMRARCLNPKSKLWKWYGGKGITICKRWDRFEHFLSDMGTAPSEQYSIDRINPNKGYKPSNCRWLLRNLQNRNRGDNVLLTWNGKTMMLAEWAEHLGWAYHTIKSRYYKGWSTERILTTLPRVCKRV